MTENAAGIIDVHSHIIPGADDGSRYFGETRNLLQSAYEQGVRGIIATPHYIHHHNRMRAAQIREKAEKVRQLAQEAVPGLAIYTGAELFYYEGLTEALQSGRALTLADTQYVLVEFSPAVAYQELYRAVRTLTQARYIPVLAHIERYRCLRKKGCIEELIHMGAYMQMNFSSLSELRSPMERMWCRGAVREGKIHLLGSDMHRLDFRPPRIEKAAAWLQKTDEACFQRLVYTNPSRLLSGERI